MSSAVKPAVPELRDLDEERQRMAVPRPPVVESPHRPGWAAPLAVIPATPPRRGTR